MLGNCRIWIILSSPVELKIYLTFEKNYASFVVNLAIAHENCQDVRSVYDYEFEYMSKSVWLWVSVCVSVLKV